MKRLIFVATAALVFAAEAKFEKVADVTVADQQRVVAAVNKIGQFTGNPMLGVATAMYWSVNPIATGGFGAMRPDGRFYAALYVDGYKKGKPIDKLAKDFHFVALYPASCTKEQFLAFKPGAKENSGAIDISADGDIKAVFAEDGKYVAFSDKPELAKMALTEVSKIPEVPLDRVMCLRVTPVGMNMVNDVLDSLNTSLKMSMDQRCLQFQQCLELLKPITGFTLMCGAGSYGIDFEVNIEYKPGLRALGNKNLSSPAPLAFAGRDSVYAFAFAEDSLGYDLNFCFSTLVDVANKHGVETNWLKIEKQGFNKKFTVDFVLLCEYLKRCSATRNQKPSGNFDKFVEDYANAFNNVILTKNPEHGTAICFKNSGLTGNAQSRFNKTLPVYSNKPCYAVGVFSIYATIKSIMKNVIPYINDAEKYGLCGVCDAMPDASDAAIAYASVSTGPTTINTIIRINPAEIKGLYFLTATAIQVVENISSKIKVLRNQGIKKDKDDE